MSLLNISNAEWEMAEKFFQDPSSHHKKLSRRYSPSYHKSNEDCHSFIKINNEIYALQANGYLGFGGDGNVKIAQNKRGENFAVKIEGSPLKDENSLLIKTLKEMGYFLGQFLRPLNGPILFKDKITDHKLYTLIKLRNGHELFELLTQNNYTLTQRIMMALHICLKTQKLHNYEMVHGDIKPDNLMSVIHGHQIKMKYIDFDFSFMMPRGAKYVEFNEYFGTPGYIAPECISDGLYSIESDIYALGVLFKDDLHLPSTFYREMLNPLASQRPTLIQVIRSLNQALKQRPDLDQDALNLIDRVDHYRVPNQEPALCNQYLEAMNKAALPYQKPKAADELYGENNFEIGKVNSQVEEINKRCRRLKLK